MGRARKITSDDILDAAERVVVRLGAAGLSIDAVAREAGVSKSRVVYDHKSKSALMEALIDRRLKIEKELQAVFIEENRETPHPKLFALIASAERSQNETERAICVAISTSVSSEEKLQQKMRDWTETEVEAMALGKKPQAALMAYLALTGFYALEMFDFYRWGDAGRRRIIEGVRTVYASYPEHDDRSSAYDSRLEETI